MNKILCLIFSMFLLSSVAFGGGTGIMGGRSFDGIFTGDLDISGDIRGGTDLIIGGDSSDVWIRLWESTNGWCFKHEASTNHLVFLSTYGGAEILRISADGHYGFNGNPHGTSAYFFYDWGQNEFNITSRNDNAILNICADDVNTATTINQDPLIYFWSAGVYGGEIRLDNDHATGKAMELNVKTSSGHQLALLNSGDIQMSEGGLLCLRIAVSTSDTTTNYGIARIYGVTDTSAARTITISTAHIATGRLFTIKDESGAAGTNNITIATEASETIDGAATAVISTDYGSLELYSDGTDLFIY